MQQGIKLDLKIRNKVIKMYVAGEIRKTKIAKHFNISRGSVINILKQNNIKNIEEHRYSHREVKDYFAKHGCKLLSKFEKTSIIMDYVCKCGMQSKIRFSDFIMGKRCRNCVKIKFKHSKEFVFNYLKDKGYTVISQDYIKASIPLELICPNGHKINMTYSSIRNGGHICKNCGHNSRCGENHPLWNKNKTHLQRTKERKTPEVKKWRNSVFIRDDFTCQKCNKRGGKLCAHHLNGYHWDIKNRLNPDNGDTLCKKCHNEFHSKYSNKNNTKEQYYEWNKSARRRLISSS